MQQKLSPERIKHLSNRMKEILGLRSFSVGAMLLLDYEKYPEEAQFLSQHRYCQALMKARRGEHVILDGEEISCPAAAYVFGFCPLSKGLKIRQGARRFWDCSGRNSGQEDVQRDAEV